MWDAKKDYWSGVANQPKDNSDPAGTGYATSKADERWYNEIKGGGPAPLNASNKAKDCPNANECKWYVMKGDPHWDNSTLLRRDMFFLAVKHSTIRKTTPMEETPTRRLLRVGPVI